MRQHEQPHYGWLDLLRFVSALVVVLTHARGFVFQDYGNLASESKTLPVMVFFAITRLGHEAVVIFFVLSGYLVGGKAAERMMQGTFRPLEYAIDRFTRIWLPLVPALLLSVALSGASFSAGNWAGNLLGLQGLLSPVLGGNAPLWSLAYEIWFYVLAFALGRLAIARKVDFFSIGLLFLSALVFANLQAQYLFCWTFGVIFYVWPPKLSLGAGLSLAAVLAIVAVGGLQLGGDGVMQVSTQWSLARPALELLLALGGGIACVCLARLKASRLSSAAVPLAAFSYTLYLTHYPVLALLKRIGFERIPVIDPRSIAIFGAAVSSCILLAWVMYLPFERKTAQLRSWLKGHARSAMGNSVS